MNNQVIFKTEININKKEWAQQVHNSMMANGGVERLHIVPIPNDLCKLNELKKMGWYQPKEFMNKKNIAVLASTKIPPKTFHGSKIML